MFFDPLYFVLLAPAMLLALWAQYRVHSTYQNANRYAPGSGMTGAQAAAALLQDAGVEGVRIEPTEGVLSDHYDPRGKVLRLSEGVFGQRTLAAVGIAAHEAGHAIQDARGYAPLALRNGLVPLASIGSNMAFLVILVGFFMHAFSLVIAGIALFSATVVFQLVNLPVEFDASRRARFALVDTGLLTRDEEVEVGKVLNAAALTYVAATLSSVLTLIYFVVRYGGRD